MFPLITILLLIFSITPIKAIEPTPTLNPIEEKVRSIVAENNDTDENTVSTQPKSFFGSITQITDDIITINFNNQNQIIRTNTDTTFINSKRQKSKISDFKVGQTILSMGYLNSDKSLDCRRIVATEVKSIENNNQIVTGQIVDVSQSQSSSIFSLIPLQNKNSQGYQIKIDSKTETTNSNQKKLSSNSIIVSGKKIIAVIHPDSENSQTFTATKIISLESDTSSPTPTTTAKQ